MVRAILVALGMIAIGAAISYFEIYQPYEEMSQHAGDISISQKGVLLGPFAFVMGIGLLQMALFTSPPTSTKKAKAGNWIIGIFAVLGIAAGGYVAFKWLPDQEARFGYSDGS